MEGESPRIFLKDFVIHATGWHLIFLFTSQRNNIGLTLCCSSVIILQFKMIFSVISDTELIDHLKAGDKTAFEELYNRYWKTLYAQALRKTGYKEDAVDIVQELFIEIWNKHATLVITHTVEGYLRSSLFYKILKHFHLKGFHEKHLRNFQAYAVAVSGSEHYFDASELASVELRHEELMQVINATIEHMPGRMRQIFTMSRFQEYSIAEIAAQLNISPQTVKNQISEAFSRLRHATEHYTVNTPGIILLLWLGNP